MGRSPVRGQSDVRGKGAPAPAPPTRGGGTETVPLRGGRGGTGPRVRNGGRGIRGKACAALGNRWSPVGRLPGLRTPPDTSLQQQRERAVHLVEGALRLERLSV